MSSQSSVPPPRPVSLAAIIVIFLGFGLLLILNRLVYRPLPLLPAYGSAEGTPKDQAWQASAEGRRAYLVQLRAGQEKQAGSYAWIDRKAGVVQLPIRRAMELIAQEDSQRK